ncbi:unnamed protein product [Rhizophagus irregularis]|nr:unnamed protein product [Rhizophagus irregularis]
MIETTRSRPNNSNPDQRSSNASNQADQLDEIMLVLKDIREEMVNIKQHILALELSDQDQKTYFWRQSPELFIYTSYTESLTCSYHDVPSGLISNNLPSTNVSSPHIKARNHEVQEFQSVHANINSKLDTLTTHISRFIDSITYDRSTTEGAFDASSK